MHQAQLCFQKISTINCACAAVIQIFDRDRASLLPWLFDPYDELADPGKAKATLQTPLAIIYSFIYSFVK